MGCSRAASAQCATQSRTSSNRAESSAVDGPRNGIESGTNGTPLAHALR